MSKVRLTMNIEESLKKYFDSLAKEEGVAFAELLERGLGVIKTFQKQRHIGRKHLGFVANRTKLDAELVGILNNV